MEGCSVVASCPQAGRYRRACSQESAGNGLMHGGRQVPCVRECVNHSGLHTGCPALQSASSGRRSAIACQFWPASTRQIESVFCMGGFSSVVCGRVLRACCCSSSLAYEITAPAMHCNALSAVQHTALVAGVWRVVCHCRCCDWWAWWLLAGWCCLNAALRLHSVLAWQCLHTMRHMRKDWLCMH